MDISPTLPLLIMFHHLAVPQPALIISNVKRARRAYKLCYRAIFEDEAQRMQMKVFIGKTTSP